MPGLKKTIGALPVDDYQRTELLARFRKRNDDADELNEVLALPWGKIRADENTESEISCNYVFTKRNKLVEQFLNNSVKLAPLHPISNCSIVGDYANTTMGVSALARAIASKLNRPIQVIKLGKKTKAADLLGTEAALGSVMRAVKNAKTKHLVIYFKNVQNVKDEKVLKILRSLADLKKKRNFVDRFIGVPFDLSQVVFVAALIPRLGKTTLEEYRNLHSYLKAFGQIYKKLDLLPEERVEILKRQFLLPELAKRGLERLESAFSDEFLEVFVEKHATNASKPPCCPELCKKLLEVVEWAAKTKETMNSEKLINREKQFHQLPVHQLECGESLHTALKQKCVKQEFPKSKTSVRSADVMTRILCAGGGYGYVRFMTTKFWSQRQVNAEVNNVPMLEGSIDAALYYLKNYAKRYGIPNEKLESEVKAYFYSGDGPSAGCANLCSLLSLFTGRQIRSDTVTTGTIDHAGRISAIGGVYLKAKAAYDIGFRRIVLPLGNKGYVMKEWSEKLKREMKVIYVETAEEVIDAMMEAEEKAVLKKKTNNLDLLRQNATTRAPVAGIAAGSRKNNKSKAQRRC